MKASSINGTSDNTCRCGSWLAHWKQFGGNTAYPDCAAYGCSSRATVGAHVQKEYGTKWYIIPLCTAHNNLRGQTITVKASTVFVPANKSETGG